MAINPLYVLAPSLQQYFVDKDTGLPLAGGRVYFYKDTARTVLKPVYQITGNPPDYSFIALPNPIVLSAVGTIQDDDDNDILEYYYPYDAEGNIELYYIRVASATGVEQFVRQAFPSSNDNSPSAESTNIDNFIPNPQFLTHNNIPAVEQNNYTAGKIYQNITTIAPGNWTFEHDGSGENISVTFPRYGSITTLPTSNPRYAVQISVQVAGSDTYKDLRVFFRNVNIFTNSSEAYNLYFEGNAVGSAITGYQVLLYRNYGSGGSIPTTTPIQVFNLTTSVQKYNIPITFLVDNSKNIGPGNDDYIQICLRFPASLVGTAKFTNFVLKTGNTQLSAFPVQTYAQQIALSTAGESPDNSYDGMNLYLNVLNGPNGYIYDRSMIGTTFEDASGKDPEEFGATALVCNGDAYLTEAYSPFGVPYRRLQQVLWKDSYNYPLYGTGTDFITCDGYNNGSTGFLFITTNKQGLVPVTSQPGTVFGNIGLPHLGISTYTFARAMVGGILQQNMEVGAVTNPDVGSLSVAGWSVNVLYNSPLVKATWIWTIPGLPGPSNYINFSTTTGNYYLWFEENGIGTDPAIPNRTGIVFDYVPTAMDVFLQKLGAVMSGYQQTLITLPAGNEIPSGAYFDVHLNNNTGENVARIWAEVDGVGVNPATAGQISVKVPVLSTDTSTSIQPKFMRAINSKYFAVPDTRGMVSIGAADGGGGVELDTIMRITVNPFGIFGINAVGAFEFDGIKQHTHTTAQTGRFLGMSTSGSAGDYLLCENRGSDLGANPPVLNITVNQTGQSQNRMNNIAFRRYIRY